MLNIQEALLYHFSPSCCCVHLYLDVRYYNVRSRDAPGLAHLELRGRMLPDIYKEIFWCHQRVVPYWSHHRGPKAAHRFITTSSLGAVTISTHCLSHCSVCQ